MSISLLSNCIANINGAAQSTRSVVRVPNTKLIREILLLLQNLGYLRGFHVVNLRCIRIYLRISSTGVPVLRGLKQISCSGSRVFLKVSKLGFITTNTTKSTQHLLTTNAKGLIISTSRGLRSITGFSSSKATSQRLRCGGEVLVSYF